MNNPEVREASLLLWARGRNIAGILITPSNHLICTKDFLRVLFLPKDSENIDDPKCFAPPK